MSRPCYCNDCRAVREAPISVGKGTERYGRFLVAGTAIRIGDNTYSYGNDEIYLPNDLEGFWIGGTHAYPHANKRSHSTQT